MVTGDIAIDLLTILLLLATGSVVAVATAARIGAAGTMLFAGAILLGYKLCEWGGFS